MDAWSFSYFTRSKEGAEGWMSRMKRCFQDTAGQLVHRWTQQLKGCARTCTESTQTKSPQGARRWSWCPTPGWGHWQLMAGKTQAIGSHQRCGPRFSSCLSISMYFSGAEWNPWVGKNKEHLKLGGTSGRGMKEELELIEALYVWTKFSNH